MDNGEPGGSRPEARDRRDARAAAAVASSSAVSPDGVSGAAHGFQDFSTFVEGDLVASRFRVIRFIARGGMGEVYEAQDLELQDRVALKTIRPEIAGSEQALKRFRREVLLARKVTHPNVCRTFDVFRHQVLSPPDRRSPDRELVVVAMELLSGETLAERLQRLGRLSPAEAFAIARQMAAALDAAHDAGVVHRDFKSSNVMLLAPPQGRHTPRVVVTDFGLAQGSLGADRTLSDTAGRLLGTPAYLAPEQIEGAPTTRAVDIYAFGVVLFEMVTGLRPFAGDTPLSTALKRLHEAPPAPRELAPDLPSRWNDVILRCLARDPDDRFPTAPDAVRLLEDDYAPLTPSWSGRIPAPRRAFTARRAAVTAVLLLVAAVAALYFQRSADSSLANRLRRGGLSLVLSSQGRAYHPSLSRDGRVLAYAAADTAGQIDLFIGDPHGEGRVRLTNDPAPEEDPRISPDGTRLVFTRLDRNVSEIWSVPAFGGQPMLVISRAASPAWSPDGSRLAFVHRPAPAGPMVLATADPDGSNVTTLEQANGEYLNLRAPDWSPDGKEIVFVKGRGGISGELWSAPVAGGRARQLTTDPGAVFSDDPVFSPDGEAIVHSSNRGGATNIWVLPRDGGIPVRLTTGPGPDEAPSIANDGTLVFSSSRWRTALLAYELSTGRVRTLATHSRFLWAPALSPDGREVAYSQGEIDGTWHIWTVPLDGSAAPRRLTATDAGEVYPRYTPDGQRLLFQSWQEPRSIWQVSRGGGAPTRLSIAQLPGDAYADMSPDGRSVVFTRAQSDAEHVYVAPVGSGGAARRLVGPGSVPRWSPDGRWIAFSRDRSYVGGVFVVGADGRGLRPVSQRGGWPVWWPDGRQIAYLASGTDGNQIVEVVALDGGEPRRLEVPNYAGSNYPIAISPGAGEIVTSNGTHLGDEIWLLRPGS